MRGILDPERLRWATLVLATASVLMACDREDRAPDPTPTITGPPVVYAVNAPLAWMASVIGGDEVRVELPVPEGVDPAHWQPSAETVLDYQRADLVLLNGAGYARWVQFATLAPRKLVDTTRGLADRFVAAGELTHTHGPGGPHDHGNLASHTWLDPALAKDQARAVAAALAELVPESRDGFDRRLTEVVAILDEIDRDLARALAGWSEAGVLFSHPVYQYLDARYDLAGRSLTWEPGEDPGDPEWQALATSLRRRPAAVMLWEGPPAPETAARLRRLGIEPVVFETGAARRPGVDYPGIMAANLTRLDEVDLMPRRGEEH